MKEGIYFSGVYF